MFKNTIKYIERHLLEGLYVIDLDRVMEGEDLPWELICDFLYAYANDLMDQYYEVQEVLMPLGENKSFDYRECDMYKLGQKISNKYCDGTELRVGDSAPLIVKGMKIFRCFVDAFYVDNYEPELEIIEEEDVVVNRFSEIHPFPLECHLLGGVRGGKRFKPKNKRARGGGKRRRRVPIKELQRSSAFDLGHTEATVRRESNPFIMPRLKYLPDSVIVDLVYPDVVYSRNNVTQTFLSWRYRANSIYDPDPLVGSGSVPGYTFWSGGYGAYLVVGLGYDIQISNMEGSPVDVVAIPSVKDLGNNYSLVSELFGNAFAATSQCASKGGMDRTKMKGYFDLGKFYGNATQYIANYGSAFGGNPPASIYLNIGGVSFTAFTIGNGLDVRVALTYRVHLFSRLTQVT